MSKAGYVYILASPRKRHYVGGTSDLMTLRQAAQIAISPRLLLLRYNINQLVYSKVFATISEAIARET